MTFDLSSLGWDERFGSEYARFDRPDSRPARVTRADRGICSVLGRDGAHQASVGGGLLAAAAHDPVRLPCAGDWVVVRAWPDERTTIEAILPRRTAIVRATAGAQALGQVLAANVDAAAVVAPVDPEPDLGLVERLLALAWASGAKPLVILTKVDLAADAAAIAEQVAEATLGVGVYGVSAATGTGLEHLLPFVAAGLTLGLLGPSGSGKSTLVNALAGVTVTDTQEIRRTDGRGRHTTTYRALVPLPGGGAVLDTPGIADIETLALACRFRDCTHNGEPACAVVAALTSGELTPRRVDSWRKLQREIAYDRRRFDVRRAAVARLRFKRPHARARGRSRP